MSWDTSKLTVYNINRYSALEYALVALFEMAGSNRDLWISDLRNLICTKFVRGLLILLKFI